MRKTSRTTPHSPPLMSWTVRPLYFLLVLDDLIAIAGEGEEHLLELSKLAEKDPEFYKYLQENDKELLDFDPAAAGGDDSDDDEEALEDGDDAMDGGAQIPILTKAILSKWQKSLLEVRSFHAAQ